MAHITKNGVKQNMLAFNREIKVQIKQGIK